MIDVWIQIINIFWFLAKAEPITDETGTSADYYYHCYYFYYTRFT